MPAGGVLARSMPDIAATRGPAAIAMATHMLPLNSGVFVVRKVLAAIAAAVCVVPFVAYGQATPPTDPSTPMIAPPPPRMLDPATSTVEDPGASAGASQRDHCRQLLDRINALPAGPQWSKGQSKIGRAHV